MGVAGLLFSSLATKTDTDDLELDHLSLPLLVSSQLEVLGPLERHLVAALALQALQTENDLLGGLGLEDKDRND